MVSKRDYLINITQTIHQAGRYVDFVYNGMVIEFHPHENGWEHYKKVLRKLGEVSKALDELEEMIGGGVSMI